MPLPKQVKEQAERANEIAQQMAGNTADNNAAPASDTGAASPPPATQQQQPAPSQTSAEPKQPAPDSQAEHRYNVLLGKYNAEVPRLAQQLRDMQGLVADLKKQLEARQTPEPPKADAELSPEEIEQYGPDFVAFVKKASKAELAAQIADLVTRIKALEGSVAQTNQAVQQTAAEKYLEKLASLVPDWVVKNNDPGFLNWLGEIDPMSRVPRQILLERADKDLDADGVARFFTTYFGTGAGAQPRPQPPAPGNTRVDVVPSGNGPNDKKIWTRAEISAFYDEKRRGLWAGREAEAARIEQDIIAAPREGRVR